MMVGDVVVAFAVEMHPVVMVIVDIGAADDRADDAADNRARRSGDDGARAGSDDGARNGAGQSRRRDGRKSAGGGQRDD